MSQSNGNGHSKECARSLLDQMFAEKFSTIDEAAFESAGKYGQGLRKVYKMRKVTGGPEIAQKIWLDLCTNESMYKELDQQEEPLPPVDEPVGEMPKPDSKPETVNSTNDCPDLPPHVIKNQELAHLASPTLDAMIKYFEKWCTRSFDDYHEAVAIWVLVTIAARRIVLKWRRGVWPALYIMLVSISGRFAKTEAASYGKAIIEACGLDYLLTATEQTPQRLLTKMSKLEAPRNYSLMSAEKVDELKLKLAFRAQKGWVYDEFGDLLVEIMHGKGANAMFYRLMKQLFDNSREFINDTQTRGEEKIDLPSLSILGTTAPDSLIPISGPTSKVWSDGEYARIAWIVPDPNGLKLQCSPDGDAIVPGNIVLKLSEWHKRLGIPQCRIDPVDDGEDNKKSFSKEYNVTCDPLPQNEITWSGSGVLEAFDLYYRELIQMDIDHKIDKRLRSNYVRFPDMALKIAMLLASLENNGEMKMCHWARGQEITERWRRGLHELLPQISSDADGGFGEIENRVIEVLTAKLKGKMSNCRTIAQSGSVLLRKAGSAEVRKACDELHAAGLIQKEGSGKSALYGVK